MSGPGVAAPRSSNKIHDNGYSYYFTQANKGTEICPPTHKTILLRYRNINDK